MTVSVKAPTSTTGSIQLNGSDVLTIDSSGNLTAPNNITVNGNLVTDTNTFYVDATNNKVGIGTSSPGGKTHIQTASSGGTADANADELVLEGTGNVGINFLTSTTGANRIYFGDSANALSGVIKYDHNIDSMLFSTSATERMRIDSTGNLKFNSGYGSVATVYGCRAWVNFNGTGTVAIRDSGNVSSITDSGVGKYRVNFSTAMPDTNYAVAGSCQGASGSDIVDFGSFGYSGSTTVTPTTSQVAVGAFAYSGAGVDTAIVSVAVFR